MEGFNPKSNINRGECNHIPTLIHISRAKLEFNSAITGNPGAKGEFEAEYYQKSGANSMFDR